MTPMILPLLFNSMSSSYSDYVHSKSKQPEEDMGNKPTVTVLYDDYHKMEVELKKLQDMKNKGSVYGYAWARGYDQKDLFHIQFEGMKSTTAIKELQSSVQLLRENTMRLDRELKEAQNEIEYLKSRNLWDRIINK